MTIVSFRVIKIVGHAHDYYITQAKTKRMLRDMLEDAVVKHAMTKDAHHNSGTFNMASLPVKPVLFNFKSNPRKALINANFSGANKTNLPVKPSLLRFKSGLLRALFNARKTAKEPLISANFDNLVFIDKKLSKRKVRVFNNIKSTIGNFAKAHNLQVSFDAIENKPTQFKLNVVRTVQKPVVYIPDVTPDSFNFSPIVVHTLPEKKLVLSQTMPTKLLSKNETLARKIYEELDQVIKK